MNSKGIMTAMIVVAALGASPALATDAKSYGGAHCRSNQTLRYDFAQAYNPSTTALAAAECPVVADVQDTEGVVVRVISRNRTTPVAGAPGVQCSFWSWDSRAVTSAGFNTVVESQRVSEPFRDNVQVLNFQRQYGFPEGYKNVYCFLPPTDVNNLRSGVVSYLVREPS